MDVRGSGFSGRRVAGDYLRDVQEVLSRIDRDALAGFLDVLCERVLGTGSIFLAGNGGSAATASHMALDLSSAALAVRRPASVRSLGDSSAALTAIANDTNYQEIYARQLRWYGRPGDTVVLLSVSGQSGNLVAAAETAHELGIHTMALVGQASKLSDLAERVLVVGSSDYGVCEDMHLSVAHMAVRIIRGVRRLAVAEPVDAPDVNSLSPQR